MEKEEVKGERGRKRDNRRCARQSKERWMEGEKRRMRERVKKKQDSIEVELAVDAPSPLPLL